MKTLMLLTPMVVFVQDTAIDSHPMRIPKTPPFFGWILLVAFVLTIAAACARVFGWKYKLPFLILGAMATVYTCGWLWSHTKGLDSDAVVFFCVIALAIQFFSVHWRGSQ